MRASRLLFASVARFFAWIVVLGCKSVFLCWSKTNSPSFGIETLASHNPFDLSFVSQKINLSIEVFA